MATTEGQRESASVSKAQRVILDLQQAGRELVLTVDAGRKSREESMGGDFEAAAHRGRMYPGPGQGLPQPPPSVPDTRDWWEHFYLLSSRKFPFGLVSCRPDRRMSWRTGDRGGRLADLGMDTGSLVSSS